MDGGRSAELLDELTHQVEARWEGLGDDRKMFFRGLRLLQEGKIQEATRVFRRATRHCSPPYAVMSRMAQARCEAARGHQGSALMLFRQVAESEAPRALRQMAWMEVADLAGERGNQELLELARQCIEEGDGAASTATNKA